MLARFYIGGVAYYSKVNNCEQEVQLKILDNNLASKKRWLPAAVSSAVGPTRQDALRHPINMPACCKSLVK